MAPFVVDLSQNMFADLQKAADTALEARHAGAGVHKCRQPALFLFSDRLHVATCA